MIGSSRTVSTVQARRVAALLIAGVFVVDQLTKYLTVSRLSRGERVQLFLGIDLVHAVNTGIAFSRGVGRAGLIIPILLVIGVVSFLASRELRGSHEVAIATILGYSLILGGAFANVADRLFRSPGWGRGAVIDMVDVGWWPIFNFADSALSVGVVVILLSSLGIDRSPVTKEAAVKEERA